MKRLKKLIFIFAIILYFMIANGNIVFAGTLSPDIDAIDEAKYPGVKNMIKTLQNNHSNYHFQVYYTGIDWTEAVTMEYQGHGRSPKNLFAAKESYKGKWYCPICGERVYDSGRWYCASIDAIKYMMDPRNSLDDSSVFQFKSLETSDVSADNIRNIINQKYPSYSYINNDAAINAIVNASVNYGLNGYSILAKIINEQGKGTSPLAKGTGYNGQYVGFYNLFNVGAYGNGTSMVILNGLRYAQNKGWNSVEQSILGGSEFYKSQYIGRGQNTLYYQRFNVVYETSIFSHQYQQDIMGAETSGRLLKSYYTNSGTIDSVTHDFIIPLYENMPATACARPSTTENSALNYEEATVSIDNLPIKASPNSGRIISYLNKGEKVKVLERLNNKASDGFYWDVVVSEIDGTYGYAMRTGITENVSVKPLPNYVFDYKYYADNNPDLKKEFGYNEYSLLKHFWESGLAEERASSPTFDIKYYIENNSDIKSVFGNNYEAIIDHFITYGCKEYRKSSELYDGRFYQYFYNDLTELDSYSLILHFINNGYPEGRIGSLGDLEGALFDKNLYSEYYLDLKAAFGNDYSKLKKHWLQNGIKEGRIASVVYDPDIYLLLNKDVAAAFGNDYKKVFEHFVKYGVNENRTSSLIFNASYYLSANPELKNSDFKQAYIDFGKNGISEGKKISEIFDIKTYLDSNADLKAAFGNNYKLGYMHFIQYGINEQRKTSDTFDVIVYKNNYRDLQNAFGNNYKKYYIHYIEYGKAEKRKAI